MKKLFLVLIGLLLGFVFGEILRHKKMQRLKEFEADAAERKARRMKDAKIQLCVLRVLCG